MNKLAKRKILFLIPTLGGGGAERVIVTLLKHIDRSRFQLAIGVADLRNAVYQDEIPNDVELINIDSKRVRYALPKIVKLIWKRQPDIVFSTLGHLNLGLALIRPILPSKIKLVARETNIVSLMLQNSSMPFFWRSLYKLFYGRNDFLICQSQYMRDDLVEKFGYPRKKAVVINNPVDVQYIKYLAASNLVNVDFCFNGINLVAAGRMTKEKGFDLLIEAIAILANPRIHLVLLGNGPLLESLKQLAIEKGVAAQVMFVGFQSNPYVWFAHADAFLLSSRYEGFPNVVLEALTCGTPVIAMPAPGGTREILDPIPECVVASSVSAQALADAIVTWMNGTRERVGFSAVEPYSLERILTQYYQVFK